KGTRSNFSAPLWAVKTLSRRGATGPWCAPAPASSTGPARTSTGHTRLFRQHFHHHESDIIHRLDVAAKRGEALADRAHDLIRRARGRFADHLAQAVLAVLLALLVGHFPDPIGADEENLTGPKSGGNPLAVFRVVHHPERQIAFAHFREAVLRG